MFSRGGRGRSGYSVVQPDALIDDLGPLHIAAGRLHVGPAAGVAQDEGAAVAGGAGGAGGASVAQIIRAQLPETQDVASLTATLRWRTAPAAPRRPIPPTWPKGAVAPPCSSNGRVAVQLQLVDRRSWTKISHSPFESPVTRLVEKEWNAT